MVGDVEFFFQFLFRRLNLIRRAGSGGPTDVEFCGVIASFPPGERGDGRWEGAEVEAGGGGGDRGGRGQRKERQDVFFSRRK